MNIIVCVKQVSLTCHSSALDIAKGAVISERLVNLINPHDRVAIEQALQLKAVKPSTIITLISAGGPEMESALRYGYAMGGRNIDSLIRVDTAATDAIVVAKELVQVISGLTPDLLLCGKQALDTQSGVMCSFMAEYLQLPQISSALEITLSESKQQNNVVMINRNVGKGSREHWQANLPLVVSMDIGQLQPRYPRLADRLAAETAPIKCYQVEAADVSVPASPQSEKYSLPRPRARSVATVDSSLSAEERMSAMTGGSSKKKVTIHEESAEEAAQRILAFLRDQELI